MDSNRFQPGAPGRLVRTGLFGAETAFLPDPLPPDWEWDLELWPLLDRANSALARLDGIGSTLPDPELLLRPLQHREAQTSSRLEGTIARPQQVLLLELQLGATDEPEADAAREVFNYGRALRLPGGREALPLSLRLIRQLHATLLEGVRGSDRNPGEFRRQMVQIGRPARFVPPPPDAMARGLDVFERYLHGDRKYPPLVDAFLVHYQFETLHPFLDGNGRVGRLLLSLCIEEWCGLGKPWLHLSPYFESNKDRYFDLLFRVSAEAAWADWIRFCLEGVIEQAVDAAERCRLLLSARAEFHELVHTRPGRTAARLLLAVDDLFRVPAVTVTGHAERCSVTYPTAKTDLETLVQLGVLVEAEDTDQRTFVAPRVLSIIYE